ASPTLRRCLRFLPHQQSKFTRSRNTFYLIRVPKAAKMICKPGKKKRQVKPHSSREAKPVSYLYGVPKLP
ncbi:MAG: hypothetical protein ACJA0J_002074, partial [Bdellovibrionota bacterium]